jgi:hypothetical protein
MPGKGAALILFPVLMSSHQPQKSQDEEDLKMESGKQNKTKRQPCLLSIAAGSGLTCREKPSLGSGCRIEGEMV